MLKLILMQKLSAMLSEPFDFSYDDLNGPQQLSFEPVVFRGRKTVSAAEAKYGISILEAPRAVVGNPAGLEGVNRNEDWTLNIQGFPPEDKLNPSDPAYAMAGAVRDRLARLVATDRETGDALHPEDYMFGNTVKSVTFGATIVAPPTEGLSEYAFWYMPMIVSLVQTAGTQ